MDELRQNIAEYIRVKEQSKIINDRKKELERIICDIMGKNNIETVELPDGKNLVHVIKENLTISKEKAAKVVKATAS